MMKRILLAAMAVTVSGMFGATPADAQDYPNYRFDIGINGGYSGYTAMLDDEHLGDNTEDVRFESGWITGLQMTGWFTPRIGLRANGLFTERPLNQGAFFDMGEEFNVVEDVNIWEGTGDLLFRLGANEARARPYLALGVGAVHINPAGGSDLGTSGGDDLNGWVFTTDNGSTFALTTETKLMGLVGLGTDMRVARNLGLRLEVGDRIWDAPTHDWPLPTNADEDVGNVVHQPYAQLGLHMLFGLEAPEPVVVAPAPPPPAPAPEPEPEPVEERIRVCVVDPSAATGLTTMDAIYLPETQDTMVVINGTRRPFATAVPANVMVANETDWFVRGEPVTVNMGRNATIEYTTWQSARMIEANQLVMLGTSRGLPIYASVNDVRDFRTDWEAARTAAGSNDLDAIVAQNAALAAELEDTEFLYVPLRTTGCVFQTVRVVEQVRKK